MVSMTVEMSQVQMKPFPYVIVRCHAHLSFIPILNVLYMFLDRCLLPYYGGCSLTRQCVSASTSCGECLVGYVEGNSSDIDCTGKTL